MHDAEYVKRLQRHLADYRAKTLDVGPGQWGDPPRTYGHILPSSEAYLNIVTPLRERFRVAKASKGWKLHRFFHHLSSSQALAFNLFLPIYREIPAAFSATRRALGLRDAKAEIDFEVELPGGDGTNIDVLIAEGIDRRTVIEVKLTEASFGRAANDERHLIKLRSTYQLLFAGRIADNLLEAESFFRDYQLFRQLAQLRPMTDDRVILLLPRARNRLWEYASSWCAQPGLGTYASRVDIVALEDLLDALLIDTENAGDGVEAVLETTAKYVCTH